MTAAGITSARPITMKRRFQKGLTGAPKNTTPKLRIPRIANARIAFFKAEALTIERPEAAARISLTAPIATTVIRYGAEWDHHWKRVFQSIGLPPSTGLKIPNAVYWRSSSAMMQIATSTGAV